MSMTRREFLKVAAALGVAVVHCPQAEAQTSGPKRYWLIIHANGGWDPSSFCTPIGMPDGNPSGVPLVNNFPRSAIKTAGNLTYAPYHGGPINAIDPISGQADSNDYYDRFYSKYASRLLFVNGIDTQTLDHTYGSIANNTGVGAGSVTEPGRYPHFGALIASVIGPAQPMAYMSPGSPYEFQSLIGVTSTDTKGPAVASLEKISQPDVVAPASDPNGRFQAPNIWQKVVRPAMDSRLQARIAGDAVLARQAQRSVLFTARTGASSLSDLTTYLTPPSVPVPAGAESLGVMLAAFAADLGVAGHLFFTVPSTQSFDTHSDHDNAQTLQVDGLFRVIDYFQTRAESLQIADKLNIAVVSEFGRGPYYNGAAGKDHLATTSSFFMGVDFRGNRTVGGVDDALNPRKVDPVTLAVDTAGTNPNAITLTPAHIHQALRTTAGVQGAANTALFPLSVPSLPLFS